MRAIISVSDKRGIAPLARGLVALGVEVFSTGGTQRMLAEAGVPARGVSELTGFPEVLGGRVKTLHPTVHAGILYRRDSADDAAQVAALGIGPIDIVVVNLYPFHKTTSQPGVALAEALEQIDIGGPTLIRAAAKNFLHVLPVVDPGDYEGVLESLRGGEVGPAERRRLAVKAFAHTASYDSAIATYLAAETFSDTRVIVGYKTQDLRYGENPHQAAAWYREEGDTRGTISSARQLQGKDLSFTNILDADAALQIVRAFQEPTSTIIKHTNPCGLACGSDLVAAHAGARSGDSVSAFGGIVGFNRPVSGQLAEIMNRYFYELVLAPEFTPEARAIFAAKQNLRLLEIEMDRPLQLGLDFRRVRGGLLVQGSDDIAAEQTEWRVVTERAPSEDEMGALRFAWTASAFVKSNAIVLAQGHTLVGMGAGQPSRVDATELAARKAGERARGAVLASDAFFPKPDGIEAAAAAGVVAIVQPGGSQGDAACIEAANRLGLAMVFTGRRHFRH